MGVGVGPDVGVGVGLRSGHGAMWPGVVLPGIGDGDGGDEVVLGWRNAETCAMHLGSVGLPHMGLVVPPSPPPVAAAVPAVNVAVATAIRTTVAVHQPIMNVPFSRSVPLGHGCNRAPQRTR